MNEPLMLWSKLKRISFQETETIGTHTRHCTVSKLILDTRCCETSEIRDLSSFSIIPMIRNFV